MTSALAGKALLISGGSRHLGESIVRRMAEEGLAGAVINHWKDGEKAHQLCEELNAAGLKCLAVEADVGQGDQVQHLTRMANDFLGRIDILVHCAGPFAMTPFIQMDEPEWDTILDVNLKGAYLLTKALAPAMREQGWGRIILMSAGSAFIRTHSIYGLAKDAIRHLTESLAVELGPQITVNAIAPGQIHESAAYMDAYEPGFSARATDASPLKRLVTRGEVAEMMTLICSSPAMQSVTGHTFVMDAGWRLAA